MKMSTATKPILAVALAGVVATACLFGAVSYGESRVQNEATSGFELHGWYSSEGSAPINAFTFEKDEEASSVGKVQGKWQAVYEQGVTSSGQAIQTYDPNVFDLYDVQNNKVGQAHLTYVGSNGKTGLLYLSIEDKVSKLEKHESHPGFVVESGKSTQA